MIYDIILRDTIELYDTTPVGYHARVMGSLFEITHYYSVLYSCDIILVYYFRTYVGISSCCNVIVAS